MNMKNSIFLVTCIVAVICSANTCANDLKFYVLESRYDSDTREFFKSKTSIEPYVYLGEYIVDPRKTGEFRENDILAAIQKHIPDPNSSSIVSLNIESEIYKNLRDKDFGDDEAKAASDEFVRIVKIIKRERPNVKVGIYGIPFRFFYASQKRLNDERKFEELFNTIDYISPSLYVMYPNQQVGKNKNKEYIESNLTYALELGEKFNKPVIPWIWHIVHPSNSEFGGNVVDKQEFNDYVNLIASVSYNNKKATGVLVWEPSDASFNDYMQRSSKQQTLGAGLERNKNSLIRHYLGDLTK